jgi:hypothetical protein
MFGEKWIRKKKREYQRKWKKWKLKGRGLCEEYPPPPRRKLYPPPCEAQVFTPHAPFLSYFAPSVFNLPF